MNVTRALLDRIATDQGSSFYLLDPQRFEENYRALTAAFRAHYPATTIAYSYKTNYIPRFCQIVDELGGFAEIVSIMEYRIARAAGIAPDRVFFNGPFKERSHIAEVLAAGGVVNADSLDEVRHIAAVAEANYERTVRIGLRCNFDVDDGVVSRFGFDVGGVEFTAALEMIGQHSNVVIVGVHCHFATRTLACWENRTQGMLRVLAQWIEEARPRLEYVSLGGGMYGNMPPELKAQFPVKVPEFTDYAQAAAKPFAEFYRQHDSIEPPMLIIEPGTALAADAMKFAARVVSIKDVRGKPIATLAGSIYNVNPTPNRKNVPIEVFTARMPGDRTRWSDMDFGGYTCIESDYLYRGYDGELVEGDFVLFDDVGSYSVVMKPPFILPNVAIVEIVQPGDGIRIIKRREEFEDLFATYNF